MKVVPKVGPKVVPITPKEDTESANDETNRVLASAKGEEWDSVLCIGYKEDGPLEFLHTSLSTTTIVYLLEVVKMYKINEGGYELDED